MEQFQPLKLPDESLRMVPNALPAPVQPNPASRISRFGPGPHKRKPDAVELSLLKSLADLDAMVEVLKGGIEKETDHIRRADLVVRVTVLLARKVEAAKTLSVHLRPNPNVGPRKKKPKEEEIKPKAVPMTAPNATLGGAPPRGGLAGTVCTREEGPKDGNSHNSTA